VDLFLVRTSLLERDGASLSLEGRQLIRAIGTKLRLDDSPSFDRIVTGSVPAAVQTAELFADRVDYVGVVEVLGALSSGVPPQVSAPLLLSRGACVAVIADEPLLSDLGAFLVSQPAFPSHVPAQISLIRDGKPAWSLRPGELARAQLLLE
jgi:phosphohistidine phosphatase SixA